MFAGKAGACLSVPALPFKYLTRVEGIGSVKNISLQYYGIIYSNKKLNCV